MENVISIKTSELGELHGRDCIYLTSCKFDNYDNLIIKGDINGQLVERRNNEKHWFPYTLKFKRVITYFSCEVDTYENLSGIRFFDFSCFDIIENSKWLNAFPIRSDFDKSIYKHFRVFTYDYVYDILAVSYEMEVNIAHPNEELLNNLDQLHTTALTIGRIKRGLNIDVPDIIEYCRNKIKSEDANITYKGKNWYVQIEGGCTITINASNYNILAIKML